MAIPVHDSADTTKVKLQDRYSAHRVTRNCQQKEKLLSPEFSGLILDPILQRLTDPSIDPGFQDPRFCLVFWARPPAHIRSLVDQVQQKLLSLAPSMLETLIEVSPNEPKISLSLSLP